MDIREKLNDLKESAAGMREDILVIYTEKGFEPFKRPIFMALPAILFIYAAIYSPSGSKLDARRIEVDNLSMISASYAEFNEIQSRRRDLRRRMPLYKDKADWLSYIMTSTSKEHGITFDSISAQEESEAGPLLIVSRKAQVTSSYEKIGKWLADIENSKIFLKITEFEMRRSQGRPGVVEATLRLTTIFPKERSGKGGGV